MAGCTSVGVAGQNIALGNIIPEGAFVFLTGFTQAGDVQTAEVMQGKTVVARIVGQGLSTRMTPPTGFTDHFIAGAGPYTVNILNSGGQESRVLMNYDVTAWGATVFGAAYTFLSEDSPAGGGCDFNDSFVTLGWTTKVG